MTTPHNCIKLVGTIAEEKNRRLLYDKFSKFGKIEKLFIHNISKYALLYYKDASTYPHIVNQLSEEKPFGLYPSLFLSTYKKVTKSDCGSNHSGEVNIMNEFPASNSEFVYCYHGHEIPILSDDFGNNYVPIKSLKCLGIKFYDTAPDVTNKLAFDNELVKEFEIFMKQTSVKFMQRNKVLLDDSIIRRVVTMCKELSFSDANDNNANLSNNLGHVPTALKGTPNSLKMNISDPVKNTARSVQNGETIQRKPRTFTSTPKTNLVASPPTNAGNNFLKETKIASPKLAEIPTKPQPLPSSDFENKSGHFLRRPQLNLGVVVEPVTYVEPEIGSVQEVEVTHVEANSFYIQLKSRRNQIDDMLLSCLQSAGTATPIKPVKGKLVFALFLGVWYRAVILNVTPTVKVQYIDYGNMSTDPVNEVREMSKEFSSMPAEGIEVQLDEPTTVQAEMCLKLKFVQKKKDGSYIVSQAKENKEVPKPVIASPVKPVEPAPKTNLQDTPRISLQKIMQAAAGGSPPNLQPTSTERKCVAGIPTKTAMMSVIDWINDTSLIAFIYDVNFVQFITLLDELSNDCSPDPNYKPSMGDTIAVEKEKSVWVRGVVIDINKTKYKCALIDYGLIQEVDNICKLNAKYQDVPECTCVITMAQKDITYLKNYHIDIPCEILKGQKLIIHVENVEIPAQGSKWVPQQSKVVMFPPSEHSVQIGDIVRISHVHKNKLFVQSRETYKLLMCLNDKVKSCEFEPLNVEPVQNQMVFHKCESRDGFCRALIKNIGKNSAEIYYIDYGATAEVPIAKLCKYDETFHKFKTTLSSIDLTSFRVADPRTIMEKLPELKKQKYVVVSQGDSSLIDLKQLSSNILLTDQLKTETGIFRKDLPEHNLLPGIYKLICVSNADLNKGLVALVAPHVKADAIPKLEEDIKTYVSENQEPYHPKLNEVCLALFLDGWFRAVVTKVLKDQYEVYYFDYGNFNVVTPKEIRKVRKDLIELPPVAILCEVKDLKEEVSSDPKVAAEVSKLWKEDQLIDVIILEKKSYDQYVVTLNEQPDLLDDF